MKSRIAIAVAVVVAAGGCGGDPSGLEAGTSGVKVIAAPAPDTVQSKPVLALTVELRDSTGALAAGKVVRFETLLADFFAPPIAFAGLASTSYQSFHAVTANDAGRASVLLQAGTKAGPAQFTVSVPELGIIDTLAYEILPGAAIRLRFSIRDTVLIIGSSFSTTASLVDRFNNPRPEGGTIHNATPTVCGLNGTQISGLVMGRCLVIASHPQYNGDTTSATVVPQARVAVFSFGSLALRSMDGSGHRVILTTNHASVTPAWSPNTGMIAIYEGDPGSNARVSIIDTNGVHIRSIGGGTQLITASVPRFSPDGQWLYFSGRQDMQPASIYRMRVDGTELEVVATSSPSVSIPSPLRVNVAPDGATIIFDAGFELAVADVASKVVTKLGVSGIAPAFSPDGLQIAYLGPGGIGLRLMDRDGTNMRSLGGVYEEWQPPQWTSDGQFVLLATTFGGGTFVRVADGTRMPMRTMSQFTQLALKPPLGR